MVIEILKTGIAIVLDFYQIYFMENILKFTKNPSVRYRIWTCDFFLVREGYTSKLIYKTTITWRADYITSSSNVLVYEGPVLMMNSFRTAETVHIFTRKNVLD